MSAPTPEQFATQAEDAIASILHAVDSYRWAYRATHEPGRGGESEGRSSGVSNPTLTVVVSQDGAMSRLARAGDSMRRILTEARRADEAASSIVSGGDPADDVHGGPVIRRGELDDARAAQRRRLNRGEGWGAEDLSCARGDGA